MMVLVLVIDPQRHEAPSVVLDHVKPAAPENRRPRPVKICHLGQAAVAALHGAPVRAKRRIQGKRMESSTVHA